MDEKSLSKNFIQKIVKLFTDDSDFSPFIVCFKAM